MFSLVVDFFFLEKRFICLINDILNMLALTFYDKSTFKFFFLIKNDNNYSFSNTNIF